MSEKELDVLLVRADNKEIHKLSSGRYSKWCYWRDVEACQMRGSSSSVELVAVNWPMAATIPDLFPLTPLLYSNNIIPSSSDEDDDDNEMPQHQQSSRNLSSTSSVGRYCERLLSFQSLVD